MPSEFDKILRNKIEGFEAPFNPADWDKMEGMLGNDSKKAFWLIPFLVLLIGLGGLGSWGILKIDSGEKKVASADSHSVIGNLKTTSQSEEIQKSESNSSNLNSSGQNPTSEINNGHLGSNEFSSDKNKAKASKNSASKKDAGNSSTENLLNRTDSKVSDKQKPKARAQESTSVTSDFEMENEAEFLAMLAAGEIDNKALFSVISGLDSTAAKKKKWKGGLVKFGIGIGAGMPLAFTEASNGVNPGYAVGLSQELMLWNRVGLVVAESYAKRNYDGGYYPCPPRATGCPDSYTSSVSSFNLGINLKVNLIVKPRWNWYVKGGITNVFKIEESFAYNYPVIDTVPTTPPPVLTTQNNFTAGSLTPESFDAAVGGITSPPNSTLPPDLTISGIERYHPEFNVATGFGVSLNKQLGLQFEVAHSFTQPIVGSNDYRLHTLELNGKLIYFFGK